VSYNPVEPQWQMTEEEWASATTEVRGYRATDHDGDPEFYGVIDTYGGMYFACDAEVTGQYLDTEVDGTGVDRKLWRVRIRMQKPYKLWEHDWESFLREVFGDELNSDNSRPAYRNMTLVEAEMSEYDDSHTIYYLSERPRAELLRRGYDVILMGPASFGLVLDPSPANVEFCGVMEV
jgi:hypothetical protein